MRFEKNVQVPSNNGCLSGSKTMGVRSFRETGGRNFIKGDLPSRKIMEFVDSADSKSGGDAVRPLPIQRAEEGGGDAVCFWPIQRAGEGGGGGGGLQHPKTSPPCIRP